MLDYMRKSKLENICEFVLSSAAAVGDDRKHLNLRLPLLVAVFLYGGLRSFLVLRIMNFTTAESAKLKIQHQTFSSSCADVHCTFLHDQTVNHSDRTRNMRITFFRLSSSYLRTVLSIDICIY
ncbi:hypothetical protein GOODEAATRI_025377 [Goodea atripinnis]|uniref:Uncharacterized protein n=1 Tax=Goodea atripinnis TaxID=208336 RepID=A0ABV0Q1M6_9TELE